MKRPTRKRPTRTSISNCAITLHAASTNEHTQLSIESLARAAQANAEAIREIAAALTKAGGTFGPAMSIGG